MRSIFCLIAISIILLSCRSSEQAQSNQELADRGNSEQITQSATNSEELEELYWKRVQEAKMNYTDADVKFMVDMIGHHAQALIMSDLAPKNGASPAVQRLAARIINAQKDEIKIMQTWLSDRGENVPEVHINGLMLMIHGVDGGHHDHMNMVGMLSQEQLVELSEAKGTEFDRLFLKYMIQHHQGAVVMVEELISTDGAVQDEGSFRLATDINADQKTEIARMKLMLQDVVAQQKVSNK